MKREYTKEIDEERGRSRRIARHQDLGPCSGRSILIQSITSDIHSFTSKRTPDTQYSVPILPCDDAKCRPATSEHCPQVVRQRERLLVRCEVPTVRMLPDEHDIVRRIYLSELLISIWSMHNVMDGGTHASGGCSISRGKSDIPNGTRMYASRFSGGECLLS
jgi:hypothetical protein